MSGTITINPGRDKKIGLWKKPLPAVCGFWRNRVIRGDDKICEDVPEVMAKAMHFESAKSKTFEVYNVSGVPISNWNKFFSELQPGGSINSIPRGYLFYLKQYRYE